MFARACLVVAGLAPSCGGGSKHPDGESVTLDASGATFQKAAQEVAIETFKQVQPSITINYGAGGSGKGRQDFADMVVDFACTDAPYKSDELGKLKGGDFYYIPNVLGAIAITYDLPGDPPLRLSPATIARIFQRDIRRWNDPAITADNPAITLPAIPIVVARRSDGSGTTENFTKYLARAAPDVWKLKSGSTINWPPDTHAGNGNGGVAQIVKTTRGSIGYVDLSDAKGSELPFAAIRNRAGTFVLPDTASVTAAASAVQPTEDLMFDVLDAPGSTAYPITAQSWCMVYANQRDRQKGLALKAYFTFLVGNESQALLAEVDFAPLPKQVQDKALARIASIKVP